jgi:hypothetical protein
MKTGILAVAAALACSQNALGYPERPADPSRASIESVLKTYRAELASGELIRSAKAVRQREGSARSDYEIWHDALTFALRHDASISRQDRRAALTILQGIANGLGAFGEVADVTIERIKVTDDTINKVEQVTLGISGAMRDARTNDNAEQVLERIDKLLATPVQFMDAVSFNEPRARVAYLDTAMHIPKISAYIKNLPPRSNEHTTVEDENDHQVRKYQRSIAERATAVTLHIAENMEMDNSEDRRTGHAGAANIFSGAVLLNRVTDRIDKINEIVDAAATHDINAEQIVMAHIDHRSFALHMGEVLARDEDLTRISETLDALGDGFRETDACAMMIANAVASARDAARARETAEAAGVTLTSLYFSLENNRGDTSYPRQVPDRESLMRQIRRTGEEDARKHGDAESVRFWQDLKQ